MIVRLCQPGTSSLRNATAAPSCPGSRLVVKRQLEGTPQTQISLKRSWSSAGGAGGLGTAAYNHTVHMKGERQQFITTLMRFVAYAVVSSPIVLWTGAFTYAYLWRADICVAGMQSGEDQNKDHRRAYGKKEDVVVLQRHCDSPPKQICVVVGNNDSGKTTVVREVLRTRDFTIHINLNKRPVTSTSGFIQAITEGMHVQYLVLRSLLTDLLPFAGGEILVLKERYCVHDLKAALTVVGDALEKLKQQRRNNGDIPVLYLDGIGDNLHSWQVSPSAGFAGGPAECRLRLLHGRI
ncbi:hypothetical protein CYMTET_56112 [Cymbomonas tetramitiformis]|uniref:Uncharacterized protein n=1 Tax=Cymbomonas tetramitiformis TaxID=36881 RepID=A0AAE0BBM0_9CHLO|nr:hypothetical protein CYMTET_56112 [Cymbomonas tetramitiformis]